VDTARGRNDVPLCARIGLVDALPKGHCTRPAIRVTHHKPLAFRVY
jgi:hypothetical protein